MQVGFGWREGNEGKRRRVVTATSTSIGYVYYVGLDKLLLLLLLIRKEKFNLLLNAYPLQRSSR